MISILLVPLPPTDSPCFLVPASPSCQAELKLLNDLISKWRDGVAKVAPRKVIPDFSNRGFLAKLLAFFWLDEHMKREDAKREEALLGQVSFHGYFGIPVCKCQKFIRRVEISVSIVL